MTLSSSAAECSGRRFYYLQGAAVFLEQALVQYALNKAVDKVGTLSLSLSQAQGYSLSNTGLFSSDYS